MPNDNDIRLFCLALCKFDTDLYNKYRHFDLFQKGGVVFNMKNTIEISNPKFTRIDQELLKHYIK